MVHAAPERERWLASHPYLAPVAAIQERILAAAAGVCEAPVVPAPPFDAYAPDYAAGVPLLRSDRAGIDVVAVTGAALDALLARLDAAALPEPLGTSCRELRGVFRGASAERDAAIRFALEWGDETPAPPHAGVLRFLAWNALRAALAPALRAFDAWRAEDGWGRPYCPTCGARPALARLVSAADGRQRLLCCGCCGTRWRWQRIGCPFCRNEAPDQLDCFEIGGEPSFRLDACKECNGYTKTWVGEGDESLFLAEWPSLHLDALARERGLRRAGASLFDV
jgi:FdhE protein